MHPVVAVGHEQSRIDHDVEPPPANGIVAERSGASGTRRDTTGSWSPCVSAPSRSA